MTGDINLGSVLRNSGAPKQVFLGAPAANTVLRFTGNPNSPVSAELLDTADITGLDSRLDASDLREDVRLESGVNLVRPGQPELFFRPSANTDTSRMLALRQALEAASSTPGTPASIEIRAGGFQVASGFPLSTWADPQSGVTLSFAPGGFLRYATPRDAADDSRFFTGTRNVVNFGASPDTTYGSGDAEDSWAGFETAKWALIPNNGGVDQFGDPIHQGDVFIPDGLYYLSAPFVSQAGQAWRGETTGGVLLRWGPDIAPLVDGVVRSAWTVALTDVPDIGPQGGFTHNVVMERWSMDCGAGNELLRGMTYAGAQGSRLAQMTMVGFAAGIHCLPGTSNVDFHNLDIVAITGRVGPAFSMQDCNICQLRSVGVVHFNSSGLYNDTDGRYMPAFRFLGGRSIAVLNLLVENCPRSILADSCEAMEVMCVEGSAPTGLANTCMLDTRSGGENHWGSLRGRYMDVMVRDEGVDKVSGAAGWAITNWTQGLRRMLSIKSDSIESDAFVLPAPSSRLAWRRDTGISGAQMFRWQTVNADDNPALSLTMESTDGTNAVEALSFARANGGAATGYYMVVANLYAPGPVNTQDSFRVNTTTVVGPRNTGWSAMTGTASKGALATYTAPTISVTPTQAEVQALADAVQALSQKVKALSDALITHGLLGA